MTDRSPQGEDLLHAFLDGDPAAHRVVSGWAGDVVRYRPWRMSREEREDIVQQAVIDAWRAASDDTFTVRVGFRAMVKNIAARRCVDWVRRQRATVAIADDFPDAAQDPDESAEQAARRARVRTILLDLRPACRDLLRLHYLEDLTYQQIAQRMDRAVGTIKARVFGCMQEVHRRMEQWAESA